MIRSPRRASPLIGAALSLLGAILVVPACDPASDDEPAVARNAPDASLRTHIVAPGTPTPEGLAYLSSMADVHARAESLQGDARIAVLRRGLGLPVPAGLAEAEIVRLDLAARLGEALMQQPDGAAQARDLLLRMLPVERSLPLDRATARALIVLGDAAAETGDDALAAGSYGRSLRMMSLLRQELEP